MASNPFLVKLAEVAKLLPAEMEDSTAISPAEWDSIDLLDLIAAIDESYGVTVPVESINGCHTVGELRTLVENATA